MEVKECTCTDIQRANYRTKLSGPLIDRFDLQIQVGSVEYTKLRNTKTESSKDIKIRVNRAREIQIKRYKNYPIYSNSELTPKMLEEYCKLDDETFRVLKDYLEKLSLSNRAYTKILKVSRTIADLEKKENIELEHVLEAMQYRTLDK